jgi:hypothetical protein
MCFKNQDDISTIKKQFFNNTEKKMGINLEAFKSELERVEGNGQNKNFLKDFVRFPPGECSTIVRILPPSHDNDTIYVAIRNHTINGKRFQCSKNLVGGMWQGQCPVCEFYSSLWKKSENPDLSENQVKELQAQARSIKPVERYFYNVVVRKEIDEKGEAKYDVFHKILSAGKELHTYIIKSIVGNPLLNKKGFGDITDIETGRDLNCVRELKGEYPNWKSSEFMDASPLHKDKKVCKEWLAECHDLNSWKKPQPFDVLLKEVNIFRGLEVDESVKVERAPFDKAPATVTKVAASSSKKEDFATADVDMALTDDDFLKNINIDDL